MMVLLAKGPEYMQYPKVKKPHLECAHTTRSRMLADLTESIGRSYILWKTLVATGHTFIQEPYLSYPLTLLTASRLVNDLSLARRITLEPALSCRISLITLHHQLLILCHCTSYFY